METKKVFYFFPIDCDRPTKRCNCDSNDEVWRQDDGYLTDKPTLPVRELRIGDTGSDDEVALYSLGELKCTGIGRFMFTLMLVLNI